MLRLDLDYEAFWLHFKGLVHCISLPHVISTEPGTRSHNIYMGLCLELECFLVVGERCYLSVE